MTHVRQQYDTATPIQRTAQVYDVETGTFVDFDDEGWTVYFRMWRAGKSAADATALKVADQAASMPSAGVMSYTPTTAEADEHGKFFGLFFAIDDEDEDSIIEWPTFDVVSKPVIGGSP